MFNITQPSIITGVCTGQSVTVDLSTYNASGTYSDTLAAANGCDSIVNSKFTMKAPVNIAASLSGTTITSSASPATYNWINCTTNTNIAGAINQSYNAIADGNYPVIVTQNACADTSACVTVSVSGLAKTLNTTNTITIQPNPSHAEFVIKATNTIDVIKITDVFGKVMQVLQSSGLELLIDIQGQAKSMYFVTVMTAGKQLIFKVVKE